MENVGSKIERIAKPISKVIDKVAGTDLEHCESCDKVRDLLNNKEFVKAFKERFGIN